MTISDAPLTAIDSTLAMFAAFVSAKHPTADVLSERWMLNTLSMWREGNADQRVEISEGGGLFNVKTFDGSGAAVRRVSVPAHELMGAIETWIAECTTFDFSTI